MSRRGMVSSISRATRRLMICCRTSGWLRGIHLVDQLGVVEREGLICFVVVDFQSPLDHFIVDVVEPVLAEARALGDHGPWPCR